LVYASNAPMVACPAIAEFAPAGSSLALEIRRPDET
jgi:hypothetical protein